AKPERPHAAAAGATSTLTNIFVKTNIFSHATDRDPIAGPPRRPVPPVAPALARAIAQAVLGGSAGSRVGGASSEAGLPPSAAPAGRTGPQGRGAAHRRLRRGSLPSFGRGVRRVATHHMERPGAPCCAQESTSAPCADGGRRAVAAGCCRARRSSR